MNTDTQSSIPSFAEARPLSAEDKPFIRELYELLKRYGNENRFGIVSLHKHFDIKEDEIMLESNNPDARTLHMEVVKRTDLSEEKFTSWRLLGPQPFDKDGELNEVQPLTRCGRTCY